MANTSTLFIKNWREIQKLYISLICTREKSLGHCASSLLHSLGTFLTWYMLGKAGGPLVVLDLAEVCLVSFGKIVLCRVVLRHHGGTGITNNDIVQ